MTPFDEALTATAEHIDAGIWALVVLSVLRTLLMFFRVIYGDKRRFDRVI